MDPSRNLSRLAALERKIQTTQRLEQREACVLEDINSLYELNNRKKSQIGELADKISTCAIETIDKGSENDILPENLQRELSHLKSTSDSLINCNLQLNIKKKEMIIKEENLNELIKEQSEVKDKLTNEFEEKTLAFNFVREKLDLLGSVKNRMHELQNKLSLNAGKFVNSIEFDN
uniref:Uncharacterized protein n=1 Tax=Strongyloides stercoralis TaxID=6248 RepID=A0A0K0ELZ0_STRER